MSIYLLCSISLKSMMKGILSIMNGMIGEKVKIVFIKKNGTIKLTSNLGAVYTF